MARSNRDKRLYGRFAPPPGRPSRLYSQAEGRKDDEADSRPGETTTPPERDAVRSFLHRKKLPTASKRRPFYSDASGLPLDSDVPQLRSMAVPVASTLQSLLKACCDIDEEKFLRQERMKEAWPALLGPELAEKLAFEKFEAGVLYAFARNSVELFEIRQFKLRALEAKARRHPAFRGLRQIRLKCR